MNAAVVGFADMWTCRIKYAKMGRIRFISHLDVMRVLTRALNRADIPVAYSKGFNPRPRISMGLPLPLGYESKCELADVTLAQMLPPLALHQRLERAMPPGLELLETDRVSPLSPSLSDASSACYMIRLERTEAFNDAEALIRDFLNRDYVELERVRKGARKRIDIRPFVDEVELVTGQDDSWLRLEISMNDKGSCSASEVARAVFGLAPEDAKCLIIMRTEIRFADRSAEGETK